MRQKLCGAVMIIGTILTLPAAHALTRHADNEALRLPTFQCWSLEKSGDSYSQRSMTVEATSPMRAIAQCLKKRAEELKQENERIRRL